MRFTDVFTNRNKQEQAPPPPAAKPQSVQPLAQPTVQQIPDAAKAKSLDAGFVIERATQHMRGETPKPTASTEGDGGREALLHKGSENKLQEALSPTDGTKGKTVLQAAQSSVQTPSPSPPKQPPKTPPLQLLGRKR